MSERAGLQAFVDAIGRAAWQARVAELEAAIAAGRRSGRAVLQRHALELAIARMLRQTQPLLSAAEREIARLSGLIVAHLGSLAPRRRARLQAELQAALHFPHALTPIFHHIRVAKRLRARGFAVAFSGLDVEAPLDFTVTRDGIEAEVVCDVVSAEEGRDVPRRAWLQLADRIDADLQTWLAAHPGRYLLKMTLPRGLRAAAGQETATLAALHQRIRALLEGQRRADQDEAALLRLDPLMLAGAQADEMGLMAQLRGEFGPEAHLSVTRANKGVLVMAARATREDDVAAAVRRRLETLSGSRLSGARPGILAMFLEDTDLAEWRALREHLRLEGEARQFLTAPAARGVIAVSCASRAELLGLPAPHAASEGELRFRNPSHPAARSAALAPAILSAH